MSPDTMRSRPKKAISFSEMYPNFSQMTDKEKIAICDKHMEEQEETELQSWKNKSSDDRLKALNSKIRGKNSRKSVLAWI